MEQTTLFLNLNTKVKVDKEVIVLKDIAKIYCLDSAVSRRLNEMEIYRLKKQDEGRCVITVLKVISLIQKKEPQLRLNSLGSFAEIERLPEVWCDSRITSMAVNVQFIFYRNKKGEVLVRLLHSERDIRIPVKSDCYPFYKWEDFRAYCTAQCEPDAK